MRLSVTIVFNAIYVVTASYLIPSSVLRECICQHILKVIDVKLMPHYVGLV